jgi:hypothetical protein
MATRRPPFATTRWRRSSPTFPPKAKNVIFMFMEGAPSQMDLFDPKPALEKLSGQPLAGVADQAGQARVHQAIRCGAGESAESLSGHGQCGMELSDYIPNIASCADDICLVRSMHTEAFNHHPGQLLLMTGSTQFGRPTLGAWSVYGLGSESENLPGFAVLSSGVGTSGGASNFMSGFLPSPIRG